MSDGKVETADQDVKPPAEVQQQPMFIREDILARALLSLGEQAQSGIMQATIAGDANKLIFARGFMAAIDELTTGIEKMREAWIKSGCYSPFEHGVNTGLDAAELVFGVRDFLVDVVRISQANPREMPGFNLEQLDQVRRQMGYWKPTPREMPEFKREVLGEFVEPAPRPFGCDPLDVTQAVPLAAEGTACRCGGVASGDTENCAECEADRRFMESL